jgi:phosphoribosylanthranilate isomerase
MSTRIKICGLKTQESVETALNSGADMLGFVFAKGSPRYINPEEARQLIELIPDSIDTVAVMLHPKQSEVDRVLNHVKVNYLQTDVNDFDSFDLKGGTHPLRVYRDNETFDPNIMEDKPFALFEGPVSGTGNLVNQERAKIACDSRKVLLAGGLNIDNIQNVLTHVRPFGVDVSSGVEIERGIKSEQKIIEFIRIVRAFDKEMKNG